MKVVYPVDVFENSPFMNVEVQLKIFLRMVDFFSDRIFEAEKNNSPGAVLAALDDLNYHVLKYSPVLKHAGYMKNGDTFAQTADGGIIQYEYI